MTPFLCFKIGTELFQITTESLLRGFFGMVGEVESIDLLAVSTLYIEVNVTGFLPRKANRNATELILDCIFRLC